MNQSSQTRLIYILGGALLVALIVIAFLAGRESKPSATESAIAQANDPRIEHEGGRVVITNDPPPNEAMVQERLDQPEDAPEDAREDAPETPAAEDGSLAEVASYFAKVDAIQAGPAGISANAFAEQIAGEAAQGKTEGFEKLQKDLDRMESELTSLTPPPSCGRFHQLTMSTLADTKMLMLDLRRVFTNGDVSGAEQIAARATAAQGKAKEIQAERRSIERRYGLSRK